MYDNSVIISNQTAGWYPYKNCKEEYVSNLREENEPGVIDVAITVANSAYLEVIPKWATIIRSMNITCAVVALDNEICNAAMEVKCLCEDISDAKTNNFANQEGWHGARVAGVKKRFMGAVTYLNMNKTILMHDADVFFRNGESLKRFERFLHSIVNGKHNYDIVIQSNGKRDVAYDGLNWGVAFIKPSPKTIALLQCTLTMWDDDAFGCPRRKKCETSYYWRSQPRINHILEESLQHIKVCKFEHRKLESFGIKHFTGYSSAKTKIVCGGMANGYAYDKDVKTISYHVDSKESPWSQREKLHQALVLSERTNRKLEIPRAFYEGKEYDFCQLFFIANKPAVMDQLSAKNLETGCAQDKVDFESSGESLEMAVRSSKKSRLCLSKDQLSTLQYIPTESTHVPLCDPTNPFYKIIHMCHRQTNADEIKRDDTGVPGQRR